MFDVGSYMSTAAMPSTGPLPGQSDANFMESLMGNPRFCILLWRQPCSGRILQAGRNAINSTQGNTISMGGLCSHPEAAASRFCVTNLETGKILQEAQMGAVDGAFYYVNGGKWYNTENTMNINWTPDGFPCRRTIAWS